MLFFFVMWLVACVSGCWCTVLVCSQYSHMSVCINRSLLWVNGVIAAVQWIGWKSSCVQHYIDLLCVYVRVCACVCSLAVSGLYNRGPLIVIVNRGCWSAAADWPFTLRLQTEVNLRGVCHQIRVKMMIQRSWPRFGKIMLCKKTNKFSAARPEGFEAALKHAFVWLLIGSRCVLWKYSNWRTKLFCGDGPTPKMTEDQPARNWAECFRGAPLGQINYFSLVWVPLFVFMCPVQMPNHADRVFTGQQGEKNNLIPPFTWLFIVFILLLLPLVHCMWEKKTVMIIMWRRDGIK